MRAIMLAIAAAFAIASTANALPDPNEHKRTQWGVYSLDANGHCHDAHGKLAAAAKCKPPSPNCVKGQLCGDKCIPKNKVCHKARSVRDPT